MIRIDNLSLEFTMQDEPFAHQLYADWDSFCHTCIEKVVEECMTSQDRDKVLYEIEVLDLDLGSIPEKDFYREFPRKLREELLKILPSFRLPATGNQEERTEAARLENLLFYLEHGYPKTEWADEDFSLAEEIGWAVAQSVQYTGKIIKLSLGRKHILYRLLWQTEGRTTLLRLYTTMLSEPIFGKLEKRRFLEMLLEVKPDIPVFFIHEAAGDEDLYGMAELLDSVSVRRIMTTEAEEHAEVDLPPYWHYLYEWLIRYYPFNGLAIFGGKGEFILHLHRKLLTFIRKRNHSFYLSKAELTTSFLLEVFGSVYYVEVLNAIYSLQPRHTDGSPVYDSYFNQELYRMFLRLSLLRSPVTGERKDTLASEKTPLSYPVDAAALTVWLKDAQRSDADKRMLLALLAEEKPEILMDWLRTEAAQENALVSTIMDMTGMATINRLLLSISFTTVEIVEQVRYYLQSHALETGRLSRVTESRLNSAVRKAVLLWIGNGYPDLSNTESIRQLLHLVYREITGKDDEDNVERAFAALNLSEEDLKQLAENRKTVASATYMQKLQTILEDDSIAEPVKRRLLLFYLEQYVESYADAILALQERNLLANVIRLTNGPILEEIIRRMAVRTQGTAELLPLLYWLTVHKTTVYTSLRNKTMGLTTQLLVWLAKAVRSLTDEERAATGNLHTLLIALFGNENISSVIAQIFGEAASGTDSDDVVYYHTEAAWSLLLNTGLSYKGCSAKADFEKWTRQAEYDSNIVQALLENRWNIDKGFIGWLEDTAVSPDSRRNLLQKIVTEKPQEWICLLRKQPRESKAVLLLSSDLPATLLLQNVARADFCQASVLSRTVEWMRNRTNNFPFLSGSSVVFSTALSQALLLYMQDEDTCGGRALTEKETVHKLLSYLHFVYTGKSTYQENTEWENLSNRIVADMVPITYKRPENILAWLEKESDISSITEIATASDITNLEQWATFLPAVEGFEHSIAFKRLITWLTSLASNRVLVSDTVGTLLLWIRETNWRKQTPEQMEDYFFSHLFMKNKIGLPVERLSDITLPDNIRKRLLYKYLRFQPKELLDYIRQTVEQNILPLAYWLEEIDTREWIHLVANVSLSQAELLSQTMDYLSENNLAKEEDLRIALATCLIVNHMETLVYSSWEEIVRSFIQSLPTPKEEAKKENENMIQNLKKEDMIQKTKEALNITNAENYSSADEQIEFSDILFIGNAGLCIFTPWLPRLLNLLGYLDEYKRDFKDTTAKIRAVFLLQYLIYMEEKAYRETELAFNRLLVSLPMHIPLPENLMLTDREKQIAETMMVGVKANWPKMRNTSQKGFLQSFIIRTGRLEQQEERWLLTVDNRPYDILLDTVPWSFKQIRFPWLKKYIQVFWHEKQEF